MLRKLLTSLVILVVAAIPLAITIANYKLNYDPAVDFYGEFNRVKNLINDISSQMTFLSITACILALSDYWDYRSERSTDHLGFLLPQVRMLQYIIVSFLSVMIVLNFVLYYAQILSTTILEYRFAKLSEGQSSLTALALQPYYVTAKRFIMCSGGLLLSSVALYVAYFFVQIEQKICAKLFESYDK